jgi:hypothetical protein
VFVLGRRRLSILAALLPGMTEQRFEILMGTDPSVSQILRLRAGICCAQQGLLGVIGL